MIKLILASSVFLFSAGAVAQDIQDSKDAIQDKSPYPYFIFGMELSTANELEISASAGSGTASDNSSVGTAITTVIGAGFGAKEGLGANISLNFDGARSVDKNSDFSTTVFQTNLVYRHANGNSLFFGINNSNPSYSPKLPPGDKASISGGSGYQVGAEFGVNERARVIAYWRRITGDVTGTMSGVNYKADMSMSGFQIGMRYNMW